MSETLNKRRKREEKQKPESAKAERREKASAKRRYAKRRAVKPLRRTWFLVKWVLKIIKILPKRHFKSKEGLSVKMPSK